MMETEPTTDLTLSRREWQWAAIYCHRNHRPTMAAVLVCSIGLYPAHLETLTIPVTNREADAVAEALRSFPR